METDKKIVLIGPPGTGKTTIKKVFFNMANPLKLLKASLEPSRGVNSEIYKLYKMKLGVFDLAGQEFNNWLNKDKNILRNSRIIICVLDITISIENMIDYIMKIIQIRKKMKIQDCTIEVLIHKIDLTGENYVKTKIDKVRKFITKHLPSHNISIQGSSIAKDYFLETYYIINNILINVIYVYDMAISEEDYNNLKIELSLILEFPTNKRLSITTISDLINLDQDLTFNHLNNLQHLGMIHILEKKQKFILTERANFIKFGIEKAQNSIFNYSVFKNIELLHTFLNLSSISV